MHSVTSIINADSVLGRNARCAYASSSNTHAYTHTHVHSHTHTYSRTLTHTHTHTHTYKHAHTHSHIHTHTYTYTHTHKHTHTNTHTHTHIHTHTHTHTHTRLTFEHRLKHAPSFLCDTDRIRRIMLKLFSIQSTASYPSYHSLLIKRNHDFPIYTRGADDNLSTLYPPRCDWTTAVHAVAGDYQNLSLIAIKIILPPFPNGLRIQLIPLVVSFRPGQRAQLLTNQGRDVSVCLNGDILG